MATSIPEGTLIRFRNFPETLGVDVAGQLGRVLSSYRYGRSIRYNIDVGPGWGSGSHYKRTDFKLEPSGLLT